jgi:hypothetical protein
VLVDEAQEQQSSEEWVACLTYKSVATAAPRAGDLDLLAGKARARNRSLDVTGMLLFEGGCFLQTLEGPPVAVAELWSSIQRDGRHNHIELLSEHMVAARLFSDWDLLLDSRYAEGPRQAAKPSAVPPAVAEHVARLVELALNADDLAMGTIMAGFAEQGWTSDAILSLLIEPAARALGDAWLDDHCSELDLTIGLSMLQLAGHAVRYSPSTQSIRNSRYRILLESEEALTNQLNAQHPDAVDIGLSDAMPRQHAIDQLRSTIEHSRLIISEHPTVVSVGGRLFAEATATALSVGADHARKGLAGTSVRLAELVRQSRGA